MDAAKRALMLKEIEYWRQTRLLPEQYCDFLMNLYREEGAEPAVGQAERNRTGSGQSGSPSAVRAPPRLRIVIIAVSISSLIFLILLNLTSFWPALQMGGIGFAAAWLYGTAWSQSDRPVWSVPAYGLGSVWLLGAGEWWVAASLGKTGPVWVVGYFALTAAVWLLVGAAGRSGVMLFSGWAGLMLGYSWWVNAHWAPNNWGQVEAAWLPFAAISAGIAVRMFKRGSPSWVIYGILGQLLWLLPEPYAWRFSGIEHDWLRDSLLLKCLVEIAAAGIWLIRKRRVTDNHTS